MCIRVSTMTSDTVHGVTLTSTKEKQRKLENNDDLQEPATGDLACAANHKLVFSSRGFAKPKSSFSSFNTVTDFL